MVSFDLELELKHTPVSITAEQLDQLADPLGFIRYQITAGERSAVVYVNIEAPAFPPVNLQNAEAYFEANEYPDQVTDFSEEDVFTTNEIDAIAVAIRKFNSSRNLVFGQLDFEF